MPDAIWRSLSWEGHDACRFVKTRDGWRIQGTAAFSLAGNTTAISYVLHCDERWFSQAATLQGWCGEREIDLRIEGDGRGGWTLNGEPVPGLEGLVDIDLGFTPASNTNAIRRLALEIGQASESVAVWLDSDDWRIKPLHQSYRRISAEEYAYESPIHDYRAKLVVDEFGIVQNYPDLWVSVK